MARFDQKTMDWKVKACEVLGVDPMMVRRIIIDIPPSGAIMVHIDHYGSVELLDLIYSEPEGFEVVILEKEEDDAEDAS